MEAEKSEASTNEETNQEYRVQVTSKKKVADLINRFKEVLNSALDEQPDISEETKIHLLQDLLSNFEAAVQINVLVNGQTWEESPDVEEAVDLESLLDDTIVETTRRRRTYPRKILPHVVHALKAERKIMGLYEETVKAEDFMKDADQESIMSEVSAAAPGVVKQAIQVIKSINTLQKQAEGLREILHTEPSLASLEIHREVLGFSSQSHALPPASARIRQPIKRAVEETATAEGYVPRAKKPECIMGEDNPE
ncbi:kinetochore-associated protein NSL1 homolog isoform X2 [Kryptolebias marmoratus]|uniref:kinetochore-associated protein NSL1 homolog isoform X2 n=1 Tax=Kryptolebias marmoratus TaxID=37003 RepID=UPI000D530FB9|nr:kinetochore-associated protein NSL1 homolog isoform X2 [Kryptolebias marmoratus]